MITKLENAVASVQESPTANPPLAPEVKCRLTELHTLYRQAAEQWNGLALARGEEVERDLHRALLPFFDNEDEETSRVMAGVYSRVKLQTRKITWNDFRAAPGDARALALEVQNFLQFIKRHGENHSLSIK